MQRFGRRTGKMVLKLIKLQINKRVQDGDNNDSNNTNGQKDADNDGT